MSHFVGRFYKHAIGNNGRVSDDVTSASASQSLMQSVRSKLTTLRRA
jgi:hypothetical protein